MNHKLFIQKKNCVIRSTIFISSMLRVPTKKMHPLFEIGENILHAPTPINTNRRYNNIIITTLADWRYFEILRKIYIRFIMNMKWRNEHCKQNSVFIITRELWLFRYYYNLIFQIIRNSMFVWSNISIDITRMLPYILSRFFINFCWPVWSWRSVKWVCFFLASIIVVNYSTYLVF